MQPTSTLRPRPDSPRPDPHPWERACSPPDRHPWERACSRLRRIGQITPNSPLPSRSRLAEHWPMPRRGARQLRKGRYSEAGRIYLITSITHGRRAAFSDFQCGRALVRELMTETARGDLESLAYVVMPDHLHWLVQLGEGADLSVCVQRAKSCSARAVNRVAGTTGQLWQRGFHDHALRHDEELVDFARYVAANPLRAGLVRSLRDYALWDAKWI